MLHSECFLLDVCHRCFFDSKCGSTPQQLQNESIYDIKYNVEQTEAEKIATTDAADLQKKCDDAMQAGFARMMSVMSTRESMEAAIRSSMIPRYALFVSESLII